MHTDIYSAVDAPLLVPERAHLATQEGHPADIAREPARPC